MTTDRRPTKVPAGTREVRVERQWRAFELRKRGDSYRAIAAQLGCSVATAHEATMGRLREVQALEAGAREEYRQLDLARCDDLLAAFFPLATGDPARGVAPDAAAGRMVLDVLKRRAALLGLDAPQQHEVQSQGVTVALLADVMRRVEPAIAVDSTTRESVEGRNEPKGEGP